MYTIYALCAYVYVLLFNIMRILLLLFNFEPLCVFIFSSSSSLSKNSKSKDDIVDAIYYFTKTKDYGYRVLSFKVKVSNIGTS